MNLVLAYHTVECDCFVILIRRDHSWIVSRAVHLVIAAAVERHLSQSTRNTQTAVMIYTIRVMLEG